HSRIIIPREGNRRKKWESDEEIKLPEIQGYTATFGRRTTNESNHKRAVISGNIKKLKTITSKNANDKWQGPGLKCWCYGKEDTKHKLYGGFEPETPTTNIRYYSEKDRKTPVEMTDSSQRGSLNSTDQNVLEILKGMYVFTIKPGNKIAQGIYLQLVKIGELLPVSSQVLLEENAALFTEGMEGLGRANTKISRGCVKIIGIVRSVVIVKSREWVLLEETASESTTLSRIPNGT
ncbi:12535_t:CDS:2, partial [Ambispora gerdemannii]